MGGSFRDVKSVTLLLLIDMFVQFELIIADQQLL